MSAARLICTVCGAPPERLAIERHPPSGGWRLTADCHGERAELLLSAREGEALSRPAAEPAAPPASTSGGQPCGFCGGATARAGTCFTCQSCGETTGCG